jgi:hypothetical protein
VHSSATNVPRIRHLHRQLMPDEVPSFLRRDGVFPAPQRRRGQDTNQPDGRVPSPLARSAAIAGRAPGEATVCAGFLGARLLTHPAVPTICPASADKREVPLGGAPCLARRPGA